MTTVQLTFFHTNDIHSCFDYWPQIIAYTKKHRDGNSLFFELGDHADRSHPITEATEGKGNVRLLNEAKVDFATIGNNEGITFSKDQLNTLYNEAKFSVIVANLFDEKGNRPDWAKPYVIHQLNSGVKIGIIGLTAPFTRFYQQLGWKIEHPIQLLKKLVDEVRPQVDVVILMSHLGLFRDEEIAETVDGIDIILGAHTHDVLKQGKTICGTLIAQAGKYGAHFGKINLHYDQATKTVVHKEAKLLQVEKDWEEDSATTTLLKQLQQQASKQLAEPVAILPKTLLVSWEEETEAVDLLCRALAEWCDQEIGMINAGVLLESLQKGTITKADIHRICPHPINPCVVKLSGLELLKTIERSRTTEMKTLQLRGFGFRGKVLGKMIFTGITIREKSDGTLGEVDVLGKPLQLDREYTIATLDMYTFGHLYPDVAESSFKDYYMPELLRDILAWKLGQTYA
ncbi:bifunctional metallophosphatase/5'-nucleotidase [Halalkalibacter urbisdiaboli]|uniref:bifunctional metallophosphatase/5'-nucleotidase n=1 Tax=Halalkalibacter urbisdiaboli TaxID=1960589 RepID=UPI000B4538FA|nr:bifunctional UDP-sugar hydrolase/5'-nucleotidase [Halalkalibacter urbisdiaboli]